MSKVKQTEETTALVTKTMDFLPTAAQQEENVVLPSSGNFFPFLEMVFPIMQPGQPIYKGKEWRIGFKNGNEFEVLPAGAILTVIDMRNVIKQTTGAKGDRKNEYAYQSIVRNGKLFDKSKLRYDELLPLAQSRESAVDDNGNEVETHLGMSMVTGIVFPDGKMAIADFAVFKTMNGYITPNLSPAKFQNATGLQINIEDHEENLVKSKFGFMYPSVKKFKQYEHVQLSKEQVMGIYETLTEVSDSYENWLNQ